MNEQLSFFEFSPVLKKSPHRYSSIITVAENTKGVLDIDTVKGCTEGMKAYPDGGCYGECYANRIAKFRGLEFRHSVTRRFLDREHRGTVLRLLLTLPNRWYRVGTMGDPSHDWQNTLLIIHYLRWAEKVPVIITKHWNVCTDQHLEWMRKLSPVVNTSMSGMDTKEELSHRTGQMKRLKDAGVKSVCRVVTCNYGSSEWARACKDKQNYLMAFPGAIDTPLRASKSNPRVINGDIRLTQHRCIGRKSISLHSPSSYLGACGNCPDQCGVDLSTIPQTFNHQLRIGV